MTLRPHLLGALLGGALLLTPWSFAHARSAAKSAKDEPGSSLNAKRPQSRHGVGVQSGLMMIPKGFFKNKLAAYTLPRCRGGGPSDKAQAAGALRAEHCAWYLGLSYLYRRSENLEIRAAVEYRKLAFPDGYWLNRKDWSDNCSKDKGPDSNCDLGMADYVELDFSHLFVGGDIVGFANVLKTPKWHVQVGGGGGLGLVVFTGKLLWQTPIGRGAKERPGSAKGNTCRNLKDLQDFRRCQPQWWDDPDTDQDGDGKKGNDELDDKKLEDQDGFASCTSESCLHTDLEKFGSRRQTFSIPVLALPKVYASARVLFDQHYGLQIQGGFNGGLFLGAGIQYFFGK